MSETAVQIDRSNLLILAFQLDGLCASLRQTMACGQPIGPGTVETLLKLFRAFQAIHVGPSLDTLPTINFDATASDILTFAEILRATVGAFLSPQDVLEKQRAMGFDT